MSKKILYILFGYSPSTQVRAYSFLSSYKRAGYVVEFLQMLPPRSSWLISRLTSRIFGVFNDLWKVIRIASRSSNWDAFIVVKYPRTWFIPLLKFLTRKPVLYECDDPLWLPEYDYGKKVFKNVEAADYVSVDNQYIRAEFLNYNKQTFVVQGPSQVERYSNPMEKHLSHQGIKLVWVGSRASLHYLQSILDDLEALVGAVPLSWELVFMGISEQDLDRRLNVPQLRWIPDYHEELMIQVLNRAHIGLFPLDESPMSIGRGTLKSRIYMSAGVVPVVHAIGENLQLIQDGVNGRLVPLGQSWVPVLSELILNQELRYSLAESAYLKIKDEYSAWECFQGLRRGFLDRI